MEAKQLESCFWAAIKSYGKLKRQVLKTCFANKEEEIEFFKEIKPKFTAFIEFFVIATESLWFVKNESVNPILFWKDEMEKYARFCERHHAFVHYYEKGARELDDDYFLQTTEDSAGDFQSMMFEDSTELHSSKDWLVRSYLAHRMYFGFAKEKLKTLTFAGDQNQDDSLKFKIPEISGSFSDSLLQYLDESGLN
jgi:hypothetical protein